MLCILPQAFPSCLLDTWQCLCRSSSLCHCSGISWPLSSPHVTRRQMLSGSIPVAWFSRLPHRNNRSNTAWESTQTFRAPTIFITSEHQSVLLDMRSLEGKKRREKKDRSLFKAHLAPSVGTAKTLGAYRSVWKKMKIPKGADNVVSILKINGVVAQHLTGKVQCCITNQCENLPVGLLCCPKGEVKAGLAFLHQNH